MIKDKKSAIKNLCQIPGVGKSIANDLINIGIYDINQLKGRDPEDIYHLSNQYAGTTQDRCLLYVFRAAVYFAETPEGERKSEKLKWWNWKNNNL